MALAEKTRKAFSFAVLDAFTSSPYGGNPAAVFVLPKDHGLTDAQFQLIARDFNLSETAFVVPLDDHSPSNPHYSLRWFTPAIEVPLCGHATLASAARLFSASQPPLTASLIRFASRYSGELSARLTTDGSKIELDFPEIKLVQPSKTPPFEEAFGGSVRKEQVKGVMASAEGQRWWIVELDPSVGIDGLKPDISHLHSLLGSSVLIITTTAPTDSEDGSQIHSRVFAPGSGIPEDPVTGSAHTLIAPYWLGRSPTRGKVAGCKAEDAEREGGTLTCKQVSARGGKLEVEWLREKGRVLLRGEAVLMSEGTFYT